MLDDPNPNPTWLVKNSGRGYAQITGGDKEPQLLYTGNGSGYEKAEILPGQSSMPYGEPTVIYIVPWD